MYSHIDGVAMGSHLSPVLANIFVGFYEYWLYENAYKPTFFNRYVDDAFVLFGDEQDAVWFFEKFEVSNRLWCLL